MKLIVGLGNPGEKYKNTRHNTGYLVLDELIARISNFQFPISNEACNFQFSKKFNADIYKNEGILLAKPQTFMNDSGSAVVKLTSFYHLLPNDLFVVHDDLDIKFGEYKIQNGIGPKVHNGIVSIEEKLGIKDFWRVRIGIDNRYQNLQKRENEKISGEDYVLQDFTFEEQTTLKKVVKIVITDLADRLNLIIK
jgi:peptidyl-tRNA hydrolase, PTH1 family